MSVLIAVTKRCCRLVLRLRRILPLFIFLCFVLGLAAGIYLMLGNKHTETALTNIIMEQVNRQFPRSNESVVMVFEGAESAVEENSSNTNIDESDTTALPNYNVHVFYYLWYGNAAIDGNYIHWNHKLLPHWNANEAKRWPTGDHKPPRDIAANFYPALGAYSSRNRTVIAGHMQQIRDAGVGVLSVSWYPPGLGDDNGEPWDDLIPIVLNAAQKYQLKVCFHIEPYKDRNVVNLKDNLEYIMRRYGKHPAFYRRLHKGKHLPVYYLYDSYILTSGEWGSLLKPGGGLSVRGTELDGIFLGLFTERKKKHEIVISGFDGFYTYFASTSFTDGSTPRLWPTLSQFASSNGLVFVPSVGPGYVDTRVRPWNGRNSKDRMKGAYYEQMFGAAVSQKPAMISITSFNEWHEGSQIERAISMKAPDGFQYLDYGVNGPNFYLKLTKKWVDKFSAQNGH